jgi:hypothetical protein
VFNPKEYEVGVVGITYVNSIRHFTGVDNDNIIEVHGIKEHERIEIPPRHFDNIEQIISLINENFGD